jgi:hypothetical protein
MKRDFVKCGQFYDVWLKRRRNRNIKTSTQRRTFNNRQIYGEGNTVFKHKLSLKRFRSRPSSFRPGTQMFRSVTISCLTVAVVHHLADIMYFVNLSPFECAIQLSPRKAVQRSRSGLVFWWCSLRIWPDEHFFWRVFCFWQYFQAHVRKKFPIVHDRFLLGYYSYLPVTLPSVPRSPIFWLRNRVTHRP